MATDLIKSLRLTPRGNGGQRDAYGHQNWQEQPMTSDAAEDGRYFAADADSDDELARLRLLEAVSDPWTFRNP